jgi:hypothetical protein
MSSKRTRSIPAKAASASARYWVIRSAAHARSRPRKIESPALWAGLRQSGSAYPAPGGTSHEAGESAEPAFALLTKRLRRHLLICQCPRDRNPLIPKSIGFICYTHQGLQPSPRKDTLRDGGQCHSAHELHLGEFINANSTNTSLEATAKEPGRESTKPFRCA